MKSNRRAAAAAPALPVGSGARKRGERAPRTRGPPPPSSPPSVAPPPAPPSPTPLQRSSQSRNCYELRGSVRRSSPRQRAHEVDADACCALGAATRAHHALEAGSQQPAVHQPQRETSSDEDSCSTVSTKTCGEEVAPVAAAAPTKRRILRHFETSLLLSTSAALIVARENVVAALTAAGESRLSNAHGVFLAQHCANATREECAFVDGRLRLWFAAGTGGDFKELFDML